MRCSRCPGTRDSRPRQAGLLGVVSESAMMGTYLSHKCAYKREVWQGQVFLKRYAASWHVILISPIRGHSLEVYTCTHLYCIMLHASEKGKANESFMLESIQGIAHFPPNEQAGLHVRAAHLVDNSEQKIHDRLSLCLQIVSQIILLIC